MMIIFIVPWWPHGSFTAGRRLMRCATISVALKSATAAKTATGQTPWMRPPRAARRSGHRSSHACRGPPSPTGRGQRSPHDSQLTPRGTGFGPRRAVRPAAVDLCPRSADPHGTSIGSNARWRGASMMAAHHGEPCGRRLLRGGIVRGCKPTLAIDRALLSKRRRRTYLAAIRRSHAYPAPGAATPWRWQPRQRYCAQLWARARLTVPAARA
jgi:hypothetical protein